jgi:hypothetical protein
MKNNRSISYCIRMLFKWHRTGKDTSNGTRVDALTISADDEKICARLVSASLMMPRFIPCSWENFRFNSGDAGGIGCF